MSQKIPLEVVKEIAQEIFPGLLLGFTTEEEEERFLIILRQMCTTHKTPTNLQFEIKDVIHASTIRDPCYFYSEDAANIFMKSEPVLAFLLADVCSR